MHVLVLVTLCSASLVDFLTSSWEAPALLKFFPEMMSGVVAVGVLFKGVRSGFDLPPKYWAVFGALLLIILCGIITNSVGTGPILAGIRYYLRAMPLFLVAAAFDFTPKQIQQQMKVLLALGLVQVPLACYQRWIIWSAGRFSGDDVRGTVMDSGVLSIMLICMVLVLTGYFMHKRIAGLRFLALFFILLLPTTINETKATVLFLPAGLLTAIVIAAPAGKRGKILLGGAALLVAFGGVLVPVYDILNANRPYKDERNIEGFFTDEREMTKYLAGKKDVGLGTNHQVARGSAIKVPFQYLARDPVQLAFGLGLGNASKSSVGENFTGSYYSLFHNFVVTSFSVFILEIGLLGTLLVFALYWMVFSDAFAVARVDTEVTGSIAAGWTGVVVLMTAATFYSVTYAFSSISYLYWYMSGIVAARRARLSYSKQPSTARPLPRAVA